MRYNCVRIEPNITNDGWVVSNYIDNTDRVDTETMPNANGFYHYPETMSFQEAKEILLDCMIAAHAERIENLTKSKAALFPLYYT